MENKKFFTDMGEFAGKVGAMFIRAWVVSKAWVPIAWNFNLPELTYWEIFFICWALRFMFKKSKD